MCGELMLTATYLCNRMPHSRLYMVTPFKRLYGKDAVLSYFKATGARAFVHIKDTEKLESKSWEGMLCGFSEKEAISCQIWNAKTRKVVKSKNATFIETSPDLIPQVIRLFSLRELPSVKLNNDSASHDDIMWDARDHTTVFDFNVNIPVAHANIESVDGSPEIKQFFRQIHDDTRKNLLISQATPGSSSSVGASPGEGSPWGALPETLSPYLALARIPAPAPAP